MINKDKRSGQLKKCSFNRTFAITQCTINRVYCICYKRKSLFAPNAKFYESCQTLNQSVKLHWTFHTLHPGKNLISIIRNLNMFWCVYKGLKMGRDIDNMSLKRFINLFWSTVRQDQALDYFPLCLHYFLSICLTILKQYCTVIILS